LILDPMPEPHFRFTGAEADDEATFATPKVTAAFGPTTSTFTKTASGPTTVPTVSLDSFAGAVERCFHIDLSGPNDQLGFDVDGAGIEVKLVTDAFDAPQGVEVKVASPASTVLYTIGEAVSMAALIRAAGYGVAYVPPSP
jgi:hypothetical protein